MFGEVHSIHQIVKEAAIIRARLTELRNDFNSLVEDEGTSQSQSQSQEECHRVLSRRVSHAQEVEPYLVGKQEDIRRLVSMVKGDGTSARVISICGMGGSGKTSLARMVFNHQEVQASFRARVWVCLTQHFNEEEILLQVLKQLVPEFVRNDQSTNKPTRYDLVTEIHNILAGMDSCLIVIDDVWKTLDLDVISPAFARNCKLLLTTRLKHVACQESVDFEIDSLTNDEGWELLQKMALPSTTVDEEFEQIGRQIVTNCSGLPLSVAVIGGVLCQEPKNIEHWRKVNSKLASSVLSQGTEVISQLRHIFDLSYDELPYYLKPCFLYLASYGQGAHIDSKALYLSWTIEGLIPQEERIHNQSLTDIAEEYLNDLVVRCMVQVVGRSNLYPGQEIVHIKLHDLMHEFCTIKAAEEQFLLRFDISERQQYVPSWVRRLVVTHGPGPSTPGLSLINQFSDVRSFSVIPKPGAMHKIIFEDETFDFEKSKKLRILKLDGCIFTREELPKSIKKLTHLRLLSLRDAQVHKLPRYICSLLYLQTLDLQTECILQLPNLIWKLKHLRNLVLGLFEVIGGERLKLDGLAELEELFGVHSKNTRIQDLVELKSLQKLQVTVEDQTSLGMVVWFARINPLCDIHLKVVNASLAWNATEIENQPVMRHTS
ncbi:hypothetical protein C2S51_026351 [Perilla frutescens var. frutescens]|nr:hypothetical protein C2S51_026351 [Perilla frutescens var. frutescens]